MALGPEEIDASSRLGERLRAARLTRNMTQSEVAQGQFSVSYISAVERGQIRPSLSALAKLAVRVGLTVADLVRDDDRESAPTATSRSRSETTTSGDEHEQLLNEAQILLWQGRPTDALDALSRLGRRNLGEKEQALRNLCAARAHIALGQPDEARRQLQGALSLTERGGDSELQERVRYELGTVQQRLGLWQVARDTFDTCLKAANAGVILDPLFRLRLLFSLGEISERLGNVQDAITYLELAVSLSDELFEAGQLAEMYQATIATYVGLGDTARAKQYTIRSIAAFEEADAQRIAVRGQSSFGAALASSGRPEEALAHLEKARTVAEQRRDESGLATALRGLATVYLNQGRLEDAETEVDKALAISSAQNDHEQQAEALLVKARIQEGRGDPDAARGSFERAVALLEESRATQGLGDAYKTYADFLERSGDDARAYELLKRAWELRSSVAADA